MESFFSMHDLSCARLENVERLAIALGVRCPSKKAHPDLYRRRLFNAVMTHLREEADQAAKRDGAMPTA